ncbi:hypothetical protein CYMTET_6218 [Cymbomonas tetramitiformis]|uniref:Uncharacterized protein n=1 Tax=Cymbomonas tetramitiformis TaxID=36881 RepID=A0AAE0LI55_9CHLO|nr:hypothetical protein CYMTET_6218 [Cymbomonas tetramitiformis]
MSDITASSVTANSTTTYSLLVNADVVNSTIHGRDATVVVCESCTLSHTVYSMSNCSASNFSNSNSISSDATDSTVASSNLANSVLSNSSVTHSTVLGSSLVNVTIVNCTLVKYDLANTVIENQVLLFDVASCMESCLVDDLKNCTLAKNQVEACTSLCLDDKTHAFLKKAYDEFVQEYYARLDCSCSNGQIIPICALGNLSISTRVAELFGVNMMSVPLLN